MLPVERTGRVEGGSGKSARGEEEEEEEGLNVGEDRLIIGMVEVGGNWGDVDVDDKD